jgi:selenocysteine lyase/cysteine desulfurase
MTLDEIASIRGQFPITERCIYLDHAFVGPLSRDAAEAVKRTTEEHQYSAALAFEKLIGEAEEVRCLFAAFIGADSEEIAMVDTTSMAISIIASGIQWKAGESVVIAENEYLSNVYPWANLARRGVELRKVPCPDSRVTVDALLSACDKTTRVVAVSWVQFANGYRADIAVLGEACRSRGILLVVDANHAVGVLAIDVHNLPIDALATQSFKWLLGPFNVGWLYLRRDLLDMIEPFAVGPLSANPDKSFLRQTLEFRPDAGRFETGVPNLSGIAGVGASLKLLMNVGIEAIEKRVVDLSDYLEEGLRRRDYHVHTVRSDPKERSGILVFRHKRPELALRKVKSRLNDNDVGRSKGLDRRGSDLLHLGLLHELLAQGIIISMRENALRVSPHFYNTEREIDQLLEVLP